MSGDDDESISEAGDTSNIATLDPGWYRGRLLEIMESWPLQLRVAVASTEYMLDLNPEAQLERSGARVSPGDLGSGQSIKLLMQDGEIRHLRILD